MSDSPLKILRYNTGNDKKVFINFKNNFDAVIFNATIVAHSGSAIADLVSIHKNQFIIDPQTHIFQHEISALKNLKSKDSKLKISIKKYLDELPSELSNITINESRQLTVADVIPNIEILSSRVLEFQIEYVNNFIKEKEYDQYLDYVGIKPTPKLIIAPYFMLKKEYSDEQNKEWLDVNRNCLESFINLNKNRYQIAAQLVIDQEILENGSLLNEIIRTYNVNGFEYIFIWIDNFSSFYTEEASNLGFKHLLQEFNRIKKKIIMAYGGYDAILLCNSELENKIYGVAQSIGYGESRSITPVGSGLPINKYYFLPTHKRMKFDEVATILTRFGYFNELISNEERLAEYLNKICDCEQCKQIIKTDINNFNLYNDSIPFTINGPYGIVSRNRPTTDATFIAAMHFMYCKVKEWRDIKKKSLEMLIKELIDNNNLYSNESEKKCIKKWVAHYVR